jgi:hypothetical protein
VGWEALSVNLPETIAWERKELVHMLEETSPGKELTEFLESGRRNFLRPRDNEIGLPFGHTRSHLRRFDRSSWARL